MFLRENTQSGNEQGRRIARVGGEDSARASVYVGGSGGAGEAAAGWVGER